MDRYASSRLHLTDEQVAEESKRFFKEYLQAQAVTADRGAAPSYANVLSLLTRMRQLCLSSDLVPSGYLESLGSPPEQMSIITPEEMSRLQVTFKQVLDDSEECGGE